MLTVTVIGGCIFLGLCLVQDAPGTVKLIAAIITVRGMTFIGKKVVATQNKDAGDLVDLAGWSLAGISAVGLIKLALKGYPTVLNAVAKISNGINGFTSWIEQITFWN